MTVTPAALIREAQRLRMMARHAADAPCGYTRDAWRKRCIALAHSLERRANDA